MKGRDGAEKVPQLNAIRIAHNSAPLRALA